jgi:hypothetical protein
MANQLTTRARALRWHHAQLLAGGTRPKQKPQPRPQAAARRYLLLVLLAAAALLLAGSFWPVPTHSLSLEPAPSISNQPAPLATVSQDYEN